MTDLFALPPQLASNDIDAAVELVRGYYDTRVPSSVFTGAFYDTLDGGGDRPEQRDRFTGADIVAVSLLSIRIPDDARQALAERAEEMTTLLAQIPHDLHLGDPAAAAHIGRGQPAWDLWDQLVAIPHIGWVTASKLLARKRPLLLPVYDNVVRQLLGRTDHDVWWPLHNTLLADDQALHRRLLTIRDAAGLGAEISPLRIFDVVCWRLGRARGFTDSEA